MWQSIQHKDGAQGLFLLSVTNSSNRREQDVCHRPEIVLTLGIWLSVNEIFFSESFVSRTYLTVHSD